MKTFLAGVLASGLAAALAAGESGVQTGGVASVTATDGDQLRFTNGDSLRGTFIKAEADGSLQYRGSDAVAPCAFRFDAIRELRLAPRPSAVARGNAAHVVELTNGDKLTGDVVALDDSGVRLETAYCGILELKRAMISRVSRNPTVEVLYAGPEGLSGWHPSQAGQPLWAYRDGAFYSPSSGAVGMGRELNLPDRVSIEFDLTWREAPLVEVGAFFGDISNMATSGGYVLQIVNSGASLTRYAGGGGASIIGRVDVPALQRRKTARIALRISKPMKTFELFVNDESLQRWTDGNAFAGGGKGLTFSTRDSQNRMSRIRVASWNDLPMAGGADTALPEASDSVVWDNGDRISGAMKGLDKRDLVMTTTLTSKELRAPLERMVLIRFAKPKAVLPRRRAADVRIDFRDGGCFTLALKAADGGTLSGDAEVCGPVSVSLDTVAGVRFHLYDTVPGGGADAGWTSPGGAALRPLTPPGWRLLEGE